MNDEMERREHDRNGCFCHSRGFKKFLAVALGSFLGVLCALCLFCATHKPYMMMHPMYMGANCGCCCPCHKHHDMMKNNAKFYKELRKYEEEARKDD